MIMGMTQLEINAGQQEGEPGHNKRNHLYPKQSSSTEIFKSSTKWSGAEKPIKCQGLLLK